MSVNEKPAKLIAVSFRLEKRLVEQLRRATRNHRRWPPGPSQTQVVAEGIRLMLSKLEEQRQQAQS